MEVQPSTYGDIPHTPTFRYAEEAIQNNSFAKRLKVLKEWVERARRSLLSSSSWPYANSIPQIVTANLP